MNTNIKKRNKTSYRFSSTQKSKVIGNSLLKNCYINNEYDNFQSTVSNITKQLNNISLGIISKTNNKKINYCLNEKDLNSLKNKSKEIFSYSNIDNNNDHIDNEKENTHQSNFNYSNNILKNSQIIISKNNSFYITGEIKSVNNNSFYNDNELRQENKNLKENIKFLLSQVKKYQKSGISLEECNQYLNNNEIEFNNKINNIISEKDAEINNIKKNYEDEINSLLEKMSSLEIQYKNLKNKYNELKKKHNKEISYRTKNNNQIDLYNNEILKMNNSEIINNNNRNSNLELNKNQAIHKINKIFNIQNSNLNFENSKDIEENYNPNNENDKRFTFHRAHHTTDFTNEHINKNNIIKKDIFNKYNMSIDLTNNNNQNNFNIQKLKNLKLNTEKCVSLNNTYTNEKENNNNFKLTKNEIIPNTTKVHNISFLYKKAPIKTEIINNNINIDNNKSSFSKSSSHNNLNKEQNTNFQKFKKYYKNNAEKEEYSYPKLIRKLSSTLYRRKNNKNFPLQNKKKNNHSYNNITNYDKYYKKKDQIKNSINNNNINNNNINNSNIINNDNNNDNNIVIRTPSISFSSRFSNEDPIKFPIPLPQIDISPNDLYHFPLMNNSYKNKNQKELNKIVYKFNMDKMKFSSVEFLLNKNSSFNMTYPSTPNHFYDIILSITNGFFIITGEKTNNFYYYNKKTNYIYDLSKLYFSHNKGALLKINNDQIMCISGINSVDVEMYYIKDNIWLNLPKMNYSHTESSYMIYNNNIIFSFFGYDYTKKKYIDNIEFLPLKNYYSEQTWNKININENNNLNYTLRNHSIFYRLNKENNNSKDIFIVGGYNQSGRNNGLIQIFIEELQTNDYNFEFNIDFKKYEENKVKIKGNNNVSLDKYNNMDNIFLFSNEFNQFFDEENNLFYSYNYDNNFNIHIIDNFTLKHTIYRNKLKK